MMKIGKLLFGFFVVFLFCFNCNVLADGPSTGSVKTYPNSIKINDSPRYIGIGQTYKLTVKITPSSVTEKNITWKSSDNSILTIDSTGKIIPKKRGVVKVTAKTSNNKSDSIVITVRSANSTTDVKKVKSISISNPRSDMLVGESFKLKVKISPKYVDDTSLTYVSSNTNVVSVNKNGKVTAVGKGNATITVKTANGKTASMKVKVKNVRIKLNKNSLTIDKGATVSLYATIETSNNYHAKNVKWYSSSTSTSTVKSQEKKNNNYVAKVTAKKSGSAVIEVKVDGEVAKANIKVREAGKDYSISCPTIIYDDTGSKIKINVSLVGNIDHWDYFVSSNNKSGTLAKWVKVNTYKGNQTLYSNYSDVQGKFRLYSKEGTSRDCFTSLFNVDSTRDTFVIQAVNSSLECPKMTYSYDKVSGANVYKIRNLYTGVSKGYINVTPVKERKYQYSWYANKGSIYVKKYNQYYYRYQLYKTTDSSFKASLTTNDSYDRFGYVVVMDTSGNIKKCYTNTFSNLAFSRKETIGSTDVYFEKGSDYQQDKLISIIKNLPKYYLSSPNVYFLKNSTYIKKGGKNGTCGEAYSSHMSIHINDDKSVCSDEWVQRITVHELSHTMDFMYNKFNGKYLNETKDMISAYNKYNGIYESGHHKYLTDYAFTNKFEFWAELNSIYYLNTSSDFKYNNFRNVWLIDNSLKKLRGDGINKINNLYSKKKSRWEEYKNMYR